MRMINKNTGKEVKPGDVVRNSDNEPAVVTSVEKPRSPASSGRIYVMLAGAKSSTGYYPSVYNCEWIEREDRMEQQAVPPSGSTLSFDRPKLELLKRARQNALDNEKLIFQFQGAPLRVDYAKYLIEYLEARLPK